MLKLIDILELVDHDMEVVYRCCCGIDAHKNLIVACLRKGGRQELREFGTMTGEIKALANWLTEAGCEMVAMESTGPCWKPLYNLLELLGADYYDGFRREHKIRSYLKQLQALGWEPELPPPPPEIRDTPCPARKSAAGSFVAP